MSDTKSTGFSAKGIKEVWGSKVGKVPVPAIILTVIVVAFFLFRRARIKAASAADATSDQSATTSQFSSPSSALATGGVPAGRLNGSGYPLAGGGGSMPSVDPESPSSAGNGQIDLTGLLEQLTGVSNGLATQGETLSLLPGVLTDVLGGILNPVESSGTTASPVAPAPVATPTPAPPTPNPVGGSTAVPASRNGDGFFNSITQAMLNSATSARDAKIRELNEYKARHAKAPGQWGANIDKAQHELDGLQYNLDKLKALATNGKMPGGVFAANTTASTPAR